MLGLQQSPESMGRNFQNSAGPKQGRSLWEQCHIQADWCFETLLMPSWAPAWLGSAAQDWEEATGRWVEEGLVTVLPAPLTAVR